MLEHRKNRLIFLLILFFLAVSSLFAGGGEGGLLMGYGFSEGLSPYWADTPGKWGFIDTTGKVVIKAQYDYAGPFRNGLALVQIQQEQNGNYQNFYIDKNGKTIIDARKYIYAKSFSEELAAIGSADKEGNITYGFIDKKGNVIVPVKLTEVGDFHEGLAVYLDKASQLYGYLDKTGKIVIEPQCTYASYFSEGVARIKLPDTDDTLFIQRDENIVLEIPGEYGDFHDGLAFYALEKGTKENVSFAVAYINKSGKTVFTVEKALYYPGFYIFDFHENLAIINTELGYGFIDITGKLIIEPKRVIDSSGKVVIQSQYNLVGNFSEGLAPVLAGGKVGFIDKTGKMLINPQFDSGGVDAGL